MLPKVKTSSLAIGWIESLIITALFIIASVLLNNPLSMKSPFPWIWFAPVLIALHYGLWRAVTSFLLLIGYFLYNEPSEIHEIHFQLFTLGGFLLTVICIIYNNVMLNKMNQNDSISNYLQKRMQNVAYSYSVLLLAYKSLEQTYITSPVTIRSSLVELRELLANSDAESRQVILNRLLNILALNCSLEVAAIFPVEKNRLVPEAIISVGKIKKPNPDDYLIKECIDTSTLTYITAAEVFKGHLSDYLVAAPLIDQEDRVYALMVVEEMPFLSLNEENLETVNLILQFFSEGKTVKNADLILSKYPGCPVVFANELQRLMNLQKNTKNDSAALSFQISESPHQLDYLFRLKREIRGIDSFWETKEGNMQILIILMPLTDRAGIEQYRVRISELLSNEFDVKLNDNGIRFKSCQISSFKDPVMLIEDLKNI